MKTICSILIAGLIVATCYGQATLTTAKLPIPDASLRAEAQKVVAEIYKGDYDKAKTSEQKIALAKKLIADGIATTDDPIGRFVLLRVGMDIAAQEGDAETTLGAIDEMDKHYAIDRFAVNASVIPKIVKAPGISKTRQAIGLRVYQVAEEAIGADRFDIAKQLLQHASSLALTARDGELRTKATERIKQVEAMETQHASVKVALATLESRPTDPDANLAVGKFRCFVKGDWEFGLPMLALGSDSTLKELATRELTEVTEADAQVALGDAWWNLAETEMDTVRPQIQRHAAGWYQKAWPALTGLVKAKVQSRLKNIPLNLDKPILLLTFERDTFAETKDGLLLKDSSGSQNHGLVFGPSPVKGKVGMALSFDGDDYVLLEKLQATATEDTAELTIAVWLMVRDTQRLKWIIETAGNPSSLRLYGAFGNHITLDTPGGRMHSAVDLTGEWHHFVATRDASMQRFFRDGELLAEQTGQFPPIPTATLGFGSGRIGSQAGGCLGPRPQRENRCFDGAIDELLILQRALSPFEVWQLYQQGVDGVSLSRIGKPVAQ